jgi:hypothetical protein
MTALYSAGAIPYEAPNVSFAGDIDFQQLGDRGYIGAITPGELSGRKYPNMAIAGMREIPDLGTFEVPTFEVPLTDGPVETVGTGAPENTGGNVDVVKDGSYGGLLADLAAIRRDEREFEANANKEMLADMMKIDQNRQLRSFGLGQIQTALAAYTKDVPKTKLALAQMEAETYRKAAELARRDLRPPQLPSSATYFQGPVAGSYASIMRG